MKARGTLLLAVLLALVAVVEIGVLARRALLPAPDPLRGELALAGHDPPRVGDWGGSRHFSFSVPTWDCDALRIDFAEPVSGAKVDVYASGPRGNVPLMSARRLSGKRLDLRWTAGSYDQIEVQVHHHLRAPPALARHTWFLRDPTAS